jgi:hypothetical protein
MNAVQEHQIVRKSIYLLSLCLAPLIWAAYLILRRPTLIGQEAYDSQDFAHVPTALTSLPFAAIVALGLSSTAVLFVANRSRLWVVFRLSRGRLIGSFALAIVTPFAVVNWLPFITGIALLNIIDFVIQPTWDSAIPTLAFFGIAALWYPVSCLIVSGINSHWTRFWLFSLMFWSVYPTHILWSGVLNLRL